MKKKKSRQAESVNYLCHSCNQSESIPKDVLGAIALLDQGDPLASPCFACKNCGSAMSPTEPWDDFEDWEGEAEAFYRKHNPNSGECKEPFEEDPIVSFGKIGRNAPCYCGSGKKYKRCCGKN